ncbi:TPA: hypothetical protein ACJKLK_001187 [Acinetobacter baumannii]
MSSKIQTPFPLFSDIDGHPLDNGFLYIGEAGKNPEVYPIPVHWDEDLTIPAEQPVRTRNGYLSYYGRAGKVYVSANQCSITVRNKRGTLIYTDLYADLAFTQGNFADKIRNFSIQVESIEELLDLEKWDGRTADVKSYIAGKNQGGGKFIYVPSRSTENDGISVFNGWVRNDVKEVTPQMGGAYADFETDDEVAFVRAQTLARQLRLPLILEGLFAKSKPFVCLPADVVKGVSNRQTRIRKIGTATSGLAPRQAAEKPAGTMDNYDVDACLIFYPYDGQYADRISVKDIYFEHGIWGTTASGEYGLYAPRHAVCETENLQFDNVKRAFKANNLFNNTHRNFKSVAAVNPDGSFVGEVGVDIYDGSKVYTGTTNLLETFLMNNFKQSYNVQNLQTSTLKNTYGEHIAKSNGDSETTNFFIANPHNLTISGCGQEDVKGAPLYILAEDGVENCSITVDGFQAVWGTNGTNTDKGINLVTVDGPVTATFLSSNFAKSGTGFIFDGIYINRNAKVINSGSKLGSDYITSNGGLYIDLTKAMQDGDGGFIKSSKNIDTDMNNGCEDKFGTVVKNVLGATLNIPSGLTDAWGISEYFGANASEGIHYFYCTTNGNTYKRRRTGSNVFTAWSVV